MSRQKTRRTDDKPPTSTPEDSLRLLSVVDAPKYRAFAVLIDATLTQTWRGLTAHDRQDAIAAYDLRCGEKTQGRSEAARSGVLPARQRGADRGAP